MEDKKQRMDNFRLICVKKRKNTLMIFLTFFHFNNQITEKYMLDQCMQKENVENQFKKFKYKQIKSLNTRFLCSKFTYNAISKILFAEYNQKGMIKAFIFNNKLKQIQTYTNRGKSINYLIFMKKSNHLAYVSEWNTIVISSRDQNILIKPHQKFKAHAVRITCMLINIHEDLIISGGMDGKIKFWKKDNLNWNFLQVIHSLKSVQDLSLNPSGEKLIASDYAKTIKVIELQTNQQWNILQVIESNDFGGQLCFIHDNQFVFQLKQKESLEIYNYYEEKKKYIKSQQILLSGSDWRLPLFQPQFIKKKGIFIVKCSVFINFFQIDKNGDYALQQYCQYNATNVSGRAIENGQFLVIWNSDAKQIQVSKFQSFE